jgi:hypothetical protein
MRDRHLIYADVIKLLGGADSVAKRLGKEKGTVDKYMQLPAPEGSGREMPVDVLQCFLDLGRQAGDQRVPPLLLELVNDHFARPAGLKAITSALLDHLNTGMAALNNGGLIKSGYASCPECVEPLQHSGTINGQPVFTCSNCQGVGARG